MSPKTTAEKLRIGSASTIWVSPPTRPELLGPLPPGARVVEALDSATVALLFADDAASLRRGLAEHAFHLGDPEVLWIAYPKGGKSDINRDAIPPFLSEYGMRPIGQVAVDEVWSALRFRPLKPGERFESR